MSLVQRTKTLVKNKQAILDFLTTPNTKPEAFVKCGSHLLDALGRKLLESTFIGYMYELKLSGHIEIAGKRDLKKLYQTKISKYVHTQTASEKKAQIQAQLVEPLLCSRFIAERHPTRRTVTTGKVFVSGTSLGQF